MKMLQLQLIKKIQAITNFCLLTTFVSLSANEDIGDITEHDGSSGIVRDTGETLVGGIGEDIFHLVPGGFQILQDFDFSNDMIRLASDMELSSLSFDESKQTLLYNSSPIAHFVNSL